MANRTTKQTVGKQGKMTRKFQEGGEVADAYDPSRIPYTQRAVPFVKGPSGDRMPRVRVPKSDYPLMYQHEIGKIPPPPVKTKPAGPYRSGIPPLIQEFNKAQPERLPPPARVNPSGSMEARKGGPVKGVTKKTK
jgi:hypothetical protein